MQGIAAFAHVGVHVAIEYLLVRAQTVINKAVCHDFVYTSISFGCFAGSRCKIGGRVNISSISFLVVQ